MLFKVLALGALAVASSASPAPPTWNWNGLVGSDDELFHPSINSIQSKSSEASVVLEELNQLLGQDEIFSSVYNNYLAQYKTDLPPSSHPNSKENFINKLISIVEHNLEALEGKQTSTQGVNQFTDLTAEEMSKYLNLRGSLSLGKGYPMYQPNPNIAVPLSRDWREDGKMTKVKNQGKCGSCYAFAAVGALEGAYLIKRGVAYDLSEQQVVDCSGQYRCDGGYLDKSAEYLKGGVANEASYLYVNANNTRPNRCKTNVKAAAPKVVSVAHVADENDLESAVEAGPVLIAVDASGNFQDYNGGVLTSCGSKLNHAVIAAGFGTEDGINYWLIKNSWGEKWGDKGYIKVEKGSGTCGIGGDQVSIEVN